MRDLNVETLEAFEQLIRKHVPGFSVEFKDESKLMAVLGTLASPFNKDFDTKYTTTWGKKVYFPTRSFYRDNPSRSFRILAHEFVHLVDSQDHWYFKLSYMLPQLAVVFPLVALVCLMGLDAWVLLIPVVGYVLGSIARPVHLALFWGVFSLSLGGVGVLITMMGGWVALVMAIVTLASLMPLPSPWRTKWEVRGYGMNVALAQWVYNTFSIRHLDSIVNQFVGPNYLFMSWSKASVIESLKTYNVKASDDTLTEGPYGIVREFLNG